MTASSAPSSATVQSSAVLHQRRRLRRGRRWLVVALVCVAMLGLLGFTAVRRDASSLLAPQSLFELLTWFGAVVVIVTALVGVFGDGGFVFWEGWMQGPDPSRLFVQTMGRMAAIVITWCISMAFIRAGKSSAACGEFLGCLDDAIAADTLLVKGIEAYTITNADYAPQRLEVGSGSVSSLCRNIIPMV